MVDKEIKRRIDEMSHIEMARAYRFTPAGTSDLFLGSNYDYFMGRFNALGGMTPEISKLIGWGDGK